MRACWLKWVGRDWSISADYIWLNYSGANNVLGNIVGIGTIAQVRQCDSKHDIPVIFDRLSKCLFFHNHLPVTVMILDEVLTIDTL